MENKEKANGTYTFKLKLTGIDEAKEEVQGLIDMLEKTDKLPRVHGEQKAEFTRGYCDELLVEVLENGKLLVQEMTNKTEIASDEAKIVEIMNDFDSNSNKLDSITRFADLITKVSQAAPLLSAVAKYKK